MANIAWKRASTYGWRIRCLGEEREEGEGEGKGRREREGEEGEGRKGEVVSIKAMDFLVVSDEV